MSRYLGWASVFGASVFVALTVVPWVLFHDFIDIAKPVVFFLIATFPARYYNSDTGWRRDYVRSADANERFPLLKRTGTSPGR